MKKNILYFFTIVFLFLTDFLSKLYVLNNFEYGIKGQLILIKDFFNLKLVYNHGAAFSFLSDWKGSQIYLFSIIAILMIFYFIYEIIKGNHNKYINFVYCVLIAGASGNLYDRLIYGYVVDFLDFYIFTFNFPVFNIADVYISLGFLFLIILEMKKNKK